VIKISRSTAFPQEEAINKTILVDYRSSVSNGPSGKSNALTVYMQHGFGTDPKSFSP